MNTTKEGQFLLKWNHHQSNFIDTFKHWLKDESFVDVTIVCGGKIVSGHKVVLAACSPLLSKILYNNPCRHPIVILNDVPYSDMKALLRFIYQGEVSVSQSELVSFLKTAESLQIKGLAEDKEYKKRKTEGDEIHDKKKKKTDSKLNCSNEPIDLGCNLDNQVIFNKRWKRDNRREQVDEEVVFTDATNMKSVSPLYEIYEHYDTETITDKENFNNNYQEIRAICGLKEEPLDHDEDVIWQDNPTILKRVVPSESCNHQGNNCQHFENHLNTQSQLPSCVLSCPVDGMNIEEDCIKAVNTDEHSDVLMRPEDKKELIMSRAGDIPKEFEEKEDEEHLSIESAGKFRGGRKPCCFCGKTFCDNYTLRRHMATHLSRQRQFECHQCSAAYSRKDHLMAHMRRKHDALHFDIDFPTK